jgi:Co/Zn/Cd efflux system component
MTTSQRYGTVVCITVVGTAIGIWASYFTNSWSLWSDSLHFFGDGMPLMLGWAALLFAFNHARRVQADNIVITLNVVWLGGVAMISFVAGVRHLFVPEEVGPYLPWFGGVELLFNAAQLWFARSLKEAHVKPGAFRSQITHLTADVGSSAIVILSGVITNYTGWLITDGVATILVGVISALAAWHCASHAHDHSSHGHHHHH